MDPDSPDELAPDDPEVAGAVPFVRGYGTLEEPDGTKEAVPDAAPVPDLLLRVEIPEEKGAVPEEEGAVPDLAGAVPVLLEYGAVPVLLE